MGQKCASHQEGDQELWSPGHGGSGGNSSGTGRETKARIQGHGIEPCSESLYDLRQVSGPQYFHRWNAVIILALYTGPHPPPCDRQKDSGEAEVH